MKLHLMTTSILTKLAKLISYHIFSLHDVCSCRLADYTNILRLSLKYNFMQGGYELSEVLLTITFDHNHIAKQALSFPNSFLVS